MRRSSPDRAQTEPTAAIVAVFAVCVGLLAYTGILADAMPESNRNLAPATLSEIRQTASSNGVVAPERLATGTRAKPDGYDLNVTLSTDSWTREEGPPVPTNADSAETLVSVRIAPGQIRPARLRVAMWR